MTQTAINYAKVLYELGIDKTIIEETEEAFKKVPKLRTSLMSPIIPIYFPHTKSTITNRTEFYRQFLRMWIALVNSS